MQIFARDVDGNLHLLGCSETDRVCDVKRVIACRGACAEEDSQLLLRLSICGVEMDNSLTLSECGATEGSTLDVNLRLLGGGADGGTAAIDRRFIARLKQKKETVSPTELQRCKWNLCALTAKPLLAPVVACELGSLFNKDEIVLKLAEKSMPEEFSHIRGLKDLLTLKLTALPTRTESAAFMCPLTMIEMGNHHKFFASKPCGCVFSDKALLATKSTTSTTSTTSTNNTPTQQTKSCPVCSHVFDLGANEGLLVLNPNQQERSALLSALKARRDLEKRKRKQSKTKTETATTTPADKVVSESTVSGVQGKAEGEEPQAKKQKLPPTNSHSHSQSPPLKTAAHTTTTTTTTKPKPQHNPKVGVSVSQVVEQARQQHEERAKSKQNYRDLFNNNSKPQSANDLFINHPRLRGEMGWLF